MDFIQDEYCRQTALIIESAGFIRASYLFCKPFGVEWPTVAGHTPRNNSRVAVTEVWGRGLDQCSPCASGACLRAGRGAWPLGVVVGGRAEGEL